MWRTLGQEETIERLSHSLAEGTTHHAYLFLGPEHAGKTTLALDFARALNCEGASPPCSSCRACTRIAEGKHADVISVTIDEGVSADEADSDEEMRTRRTRVLTKQIEDLQHAASLPPYEGRWKVLLIEHADRMTGEAANRILKTLEEPPPRVVWMLLAESEGSMLETVVSRCQRVDVHPMPVPELERHLIEAHNATEEMAQLIARASRGRTGWAIQAVSDSSLMAERTSRIEAVIQLISMTFSARFDFSREMDALYRSDRLSVMEALDQWTTWWRDLLLTKTNCAENVVNVDYVADLNDQAQRLSLEQVRDYIVRLGQARQDLAVNVLSRLVFDSLVYTMPRIIKPVGERSPSPARLADLDESQ